jgi:hypothetical protein
MKIQFLGLIIRYNFIRDILEIGLGFRSNLSLSQLVEMIPTSGGRDHLYRLGTTQQAFVWERRQSNLRNVFSNKSRTMDLLLC